MLDSLRQNKSSFVLNFLLVLVIVVFIFWTGVPGGSGRTEFIASVNGKKISELEYERAVANQLERMRQFTRQRPEGAEELRIRQEVMTQLIDQELMLQEAARLGLAVSDFEVQKEILDIPAFKDESGKFSSKEYKRYLRRVPGFEDSVREDLLLRKVQELVQAAATVSDADLREAYSRDNTKVDLEYVKLEYAPFGRDLNITEEERAKFLAEKQPDVQARYDRDFERIYNLPKKVRARHILLKLEATDAPEVKEEARRRMNELKSLTASREFAELAREFSEDPGSTANGGDLGLFDDKRMDPAFSQAAFALAVGGISDVVETRFGLHLIKVEEIQEAEVKSLVSVQNEIADALIKEQRGPELAREAADKIKALWGTPGPELDALLQQYQLTTQATGLVTSAGNYFRGIGSSPELGQAVAKLYTPGQAGADYFTVAESFVFVRLKAREQADMAKFADQVDSLRARTLRQKQQQLIDAWKSDLKKTARIESSVATLPAS